MTSKIILCGDGVPETLVAEVADDTGCGIWSAGVDHAVDALKRGDADGRLAILVGELDDDRLVRALRPPVAACIEANGDLQPVMAAIPDHGLLISLTTATGYGLEVARAFCDAVGARTAMDDKMRQMMELALHEAMVNAMVHGNLEIVSQSKDSLDDFVLFCQTIETRLADRHFGGRRVGVAADWSGETIDVTVTDNGPGYDHAAVLERPIDLNKKSGRGLFLIKDICRSVAIKDHGRRLVMSFPR